MIIGINGKIGSGKDTIGDIIQKICITNDGPEFEVKKFAGKLKQTASLLTGVSVKHFEDQEFKKLDMNPEWGMTYREFLQKLGTEAMRDGLHTNVWVNALFTDYRLWSDGSKDWYPNWIITDMRFENELEAIVKKGGITIRVVRPGTVIGNHPSETALDGFIMHYEIINDGTIEDLIEKVKEILIKEQII
jgi:hypothetical protein